MTPHFSSLTTGDSLGEDCIRLVTDRLVNQLRLYHNPVFNLRPPISQLNPLLLSQLSVTTNKLVNQYELIMSVNQSTSLLRIQAKFQ